ncbi:MAG: VOC family protein [bacterium]|nr:VOC family protein [bacterium]
MGDNNNKIGSFAWVDLTVESADEVRDFYKQVVGWESDPVSMGEYNDYCMLPPGKEPVAGICHAKGPNSGIPPAWLVYIVVDDVDESAEQCKRLGGKVLVGPTSYGGQGRYCVIQDPAGAVCAVYSDKQ